MAIFSPGEILKARFTLVVEPPESILPQNRAMLTAQMLHTMAELALWLEDLDEDMAWEPGANCGVAAAKLRELLKAVGGERRGA